MHGCCITDILNGNLAWLLIVKLKHDSDSSDELDRVDKLLDAEL